MSALLLFFVNITTLHATANKLPPRGAEAQLAKLQSELSDWVNCESCHTPEGKAKIAEISAKIQDIQTSVSAADDAKQATRKAAQQPKEAAEKPSAALPGANGDKLNTGALGQNVDEFV